MVMKRQKCYNALSVGGLVGIYYLPNLVFSGAVCRHLRVMYPAGDVILDARI